MKKPEVGNKPSLDGTKSSSDGQDWRSLGVYSRGLIQSLAEVSWLQMLFLFFPQITPWSRKFRMAGEGGIRKCLQGKSGLGSCQYGPFSLPTPTLEFRLPGPGMPRAWPFQARILSNLASNTILLHSTLKRYWLRENLGVSDLARGNSWGHPQVGPTLGANSKPTPASVL